MRQTGTGLARWASVVKDDSDHASIRLRLKSGVQFWLCQRQFFDALVDSNGSSISEAVPSKHMQASNPYLRLLSLLLLSSGLFHLS